MSVICLWLAEKHSGMEATPTAVAEVVASMLVQGSLEEAADLETGCQIP